MDGAGRNNLTAFSQKDNHDRVYIHVDSETFELLSNGPLPKTSPDVLEEIKKRIPKLAPKFPINSKSILTLRYNE